LICGLLLGGLEGIQPTRDARAGTVQQQPQWRSIMAGLVPMIRATSDTPAASARCASRLELRF
jgi:hypothetical protein